MRRNTFRLHDAKFGGLPQMMRAAMAIFAACLLAGHARAQSIDAPGAMKVIEAFATCKPDFFRVLSANAKAFGTADTKESRENDPTPFGVAMFAAPIDMSDCTGRNSSRSRLRRRTQ